MPPPARLQARCDLRPNGTSFEPSEARLDWSLPLVEHSSVRILPAEFPSQMLEIAIVFTGGFEDVAIRQQAHLLVDLPRLGKNLRVVDCNLNFHVSVVRPPKTFGDVQRIRRGFAGLIQPCLPVEAASVDDQGIAIPFASGITQVGWKKVVPQFAPIEKDLAPRVVGFIKNPNDARFLDHPPRWRRGIDPRDTPVQEVCG